MTPSRFRWGLLFIAVGVILLLNNAGYISWGYWAELLIWWPLILIAIGLEKIFLKTRLHILSYLSPLILIAGMAYVAFDTGASTRGNDYFTTSRWIESADASIHLIDAVIYHGRNDLCVNYNTSDLVSAQFGRLSRKPHIDVSKSGGTAKLKINRRYGWDNNFIIINRHGYGRDWNLSFSNSVPLRLECYGQEAEVRLSLETTPVENLKIEDRNGDIYLKMGVLKPRVNIDIIGSDAQLRLKISQGTGLKVLGNEYAGYLKTIGLPGNMIAM
ncbi:MAG: DUF5668 domain-containing protein [candidate division Zixibacteria bacterium]|nr:DUF5668 domain-containing protein [candidate division Zixibacteria bacterium]